MAEKKKEKRNEKKEMSEKEIQKRSMDIQTKAVKKRMKKNRKQSEAWNKGEKKEFFLKRWFSHYNLGGHRPPLQRQIHAPFFDTPV